MRKGEKGTVRLPNILVLIKAAAHRLQRPDGAGQRGEAHGDVFRPHLRTWGHGTIVQRRCANESPENCTANGYSPPLIQAGFSMGGDFLYREIKLDFRLHIPGQQ